jgi:hypothetical protein
MKIQTIKKKTQKKKSLKKRQKECPKARVEEKQFRQIKRRI